MKRPRPAAALVAVVALAAALRLAGIGHALPQWIDPDEVYAVFHAWEMATDLRLDPHPGEPFIWPSALFEALAAHFLVLRAFGASDFPFDPSAHVLAARAFAAACGTLAVAAAGYGAWRLAGPPAGVAAAALAALLPTLVRTAHAPTTDPPVTLLVTLGLLACARLAEAPGHEATHQVRERRRRYALAGALAGLAAGTKWNGGFLVVPLFAAHVAVCWRNRREAAALLFSRDLAVAAAAAAAALVATTPYILLDPARVVAGIAQQAAVFRSEHGLRGVGAPLDEATSWGAYGRFLLDEFGAASVLVALGLGRLARGAAVPTAPARVWLAGIVAFLLVMSSQGRASAKYVAPILPALSVAAGTLVAGRVTARATAAVVFAWAAVVLVSAAPAGLGVAAAWRAPDTREAARAWIEANVAAGETVATDAYHYTVDLTGWAGGAHPVLPYVSLAERGLDGLRADGARWLVVSSIVEGQSPRRDFYRFLEAEAPVVARFEAPPGRRDGVLNPTLTIRRLDGVHSTE